MIQVRRTAALLGAAAILFVGIHLQTAKADTKAEIDAKVSDAKQELFETVPGSRELADRALGLLIMPDVKKAGLILGGSYGEGALLGASLEGAKFRSIVR